MPRSLCRKVTSPHMSGYSSCNSFASNGVICFELMRAISGSWGACGHRAGLLLRLPPMRHHA